jgi:hypothetical protein
MSEPAPFPGHCRGILRYYRERASEPGRNSVAPSAAGKRG